MKNFFNVFFLTFVFFFSLSANSFAQGVTFISPTPDDGATTTSNNITINATSTFSGQHYILNNFDGSLVGWWRGEGDTVDESGNGNNAVLNGDATTTSGKFGQAFSFDGTGDHVSVPSLNNFNLTTSNSLTVSAWVKSDSASVGDCPIKRIVGYADISGSFDLDWDHCGLGGTGFSIYNGSSYFAAITHLNASQWYNLVGVYNGTSVKLYVDGVLIDETETTGTINNASGSFSIGSDNSGTSDFDGLIDDVTLWSRALSPQEIKALYDASVESRYVNTDNSLKGWWTGDDTTNDEQGLNNGTNSGATYSDGKFVSAFSFDGIGNYVEIPNQSYFSADDGALAISFWAMVPTDAPSISNGIAGDAGSYIVTKTGGEYGYEWGIENDGNTQICFDYWNANNTYNCTNFTVNDGLFHHYLAMFDDINGTFSFHIDGVSKWNEGNSGGANLAQAMDVPILIGTRLEKNSSHSFTGSVDDLMIFNKILSNDEIQELYNQQNNGYARTFTNLAIGNHTSQIFSADLTGSKDWTGERTFTIEEAPAIPPFANYGEEGIDGLSTSTAYTIETCQQLQNIATSSGIYLDKYFKLEPVGTTTIDCSETTGWNSYEGEGTSYYGFEPIGDSEVPFSGYFDGNNKSISNLFIERNNESYVGLFGYVSGTIKDVNLVDVNVSGDGRVGGLTGRLTASASIIRATVSGEIYGSYYVGGLVGGCLGDIANSSANVIVDGGTYVGGLVGGLSGSEGNHGTITDSSSSGTVSGGQEETGGLVGTTGSYGDIYDSFSTANVDGDWTVGGLVGSALGSITRSYSTGTITSGAGYGIGGLVGYLEYGSITESYATGEVIAGKDSGYDGGTSYAGGLVGVSDGGEISKSYATGDVSGTGIRVGGLVGGTNALIENCYAWGDVTGTDRVGGLVGGSTGEIINSYSIGKVTANGVFVLNEGDEMISNDGGGGGGGYFGGEGGQSDAKPGAGGSGYFDPLFVSNGVLTTGNNGVGPARALPPNTNDINYVSRIGLGGNNNSNSGNGLIYINYGSGDITFSYTGGSQTFVVPVGVTSINVKIWGAGGGGADYSNIYQGGSGGFASGTITVTPGQELVVIVGGGGGNGFKNIVGGVGGFGGGGYGTRGDASGAGGGGLSGIFTDENGTDFESLTQDDAIIIAGGGGGGTGYFGPGGAGGGEMGNDGEYDYEGDYEKSCGGTQEAGGSCLEDGSDGSALRGGNGDSTGIKGTATFTLDYAGGLIGYSTGTTTNSYWDTETSEQESSLAGGTGKTTAQMKTQGTYTDWDFSSPIWYAWTNDYPRFTRQSVTVVRHRRKTENQQENIATTTATSTTEIISTGSGTSTPVIVPTNSVSTSTIALPVAVISTEVFTHTLKLKDRESDVLKLQKFLNDSGFPLAKSGVGSKGKETNYFGILTKNALIRFQEANAKDILTPIGLKKGTGIFERMSRKFVNILLQLQSTVTK